MGETPELRKFRDLFERRDTAAAGWKKETGKKIVGCISTYVPEEVIYAVGFLPTGIFGSTETFSKADAYLPSFSCSFVRGFLEKLLEGEYAYLDLITLSSLCDSMWGFYGIWGTLSPSPQIYLLHYPSAQSEEAFEYFTDEVRRFKSYMEKSAGKVIAEDDLRAAIEIYNENRRLLKKLYNLRKEESPAVSGVEAVEAVLSSMTSPKLEHNRALENLLREIENRDEYPEGDIRLLVSGHVVEDPEVLSVIESSGSLIVSDDLDTGSRYFWSLCDDAADPVESISRRYFTIPSPYCSSIQDRLRYIKDMVKEFKVQGIVFLTRKFCDPYLFDYPMLAQALRDDGVPSLLLDYEYPLAKGAIKTRIEAFLEMLR